MDTDELKSLPNYRAPGASRLVFENHTEFVRFVMNGLPPVLPMGAREIIVAHAARGGGWHIKGRVPLYWYNLWGQAVTRKTIATGVLFTVLRAPGGKYHPFRAYTSVGDAYSGYLANLDYYDTGAGGWFMSRGVTASKAECHHFTKVIAPRWFAKKADLSKFADDMDWIIRNKIRPAMKNEDGSEWLPSYS